MNRIGRAAIAFGAAALGAFAVFLASTAPATWRAFRGVHADTAPIGPGDPARGRVVFDAGGCASCHMAPGSDDRSRLPGGIRLPTTFGIFVVPNLSSDSVAGIGEWDLTDFVRAMREGVAPDGRHYYPSFPYTSYQRMTGSDLADLFAYLKTLPPVSDRQPDHELSFPFSIRRGLGLWKLAHLDGRVFVADPERSAEWNRGAYLVEGPGHCAECHSPRNALGAIPAGRRFAGGQDPEGTGGRIPNITPHRDGLEKWSRDDVAELLETGFTPEYDSVGGTMAAVVRNTARLTKSDREAIATYLLSLPPRPGKDP
jgi:mono/diheme cytochrome c family protein